MKKSYTIILSVLLLFVLGCEAVPFIGPIISIGVMWKEGEAKKYYYNDKATIESAVREVVNDIGYKVIEDSERNEVTFLKVGGGDDSVFKIKIIPERENVTALYIRIDIMGNKPYADMIYREVDKREGVRCFATEKQLKAALHD